ncbi:transposase, partial [uncultured Cloacibacillus sp.]|uniref:transposase n=1 Tax=uncultured Cloacibacillus sp. TaxID=889794 RepID=UPI0026DACF68
NGKIFYTSITSLSHISKNAGQKTLCLPLAKSKRHIDISDIDVPGPISHVAITPRNGYFLLSICFDVIPIQNTEEPPLITLKKQKTIAEWDSTQPNARRICAIDTGMLNLAAITNNIGEPSILIKKGNMEYCLIDLRNNLLTMKGVTRTENRRVLRITPSHISKIRKDKGLRRFLDKIADDITSWCICKEIGTIFTGTAVMPQHIIHIDIKNDGSFFQIISSVLISCINSKAETAGIQVIAVDESYTSMASFIDGDEMPDKPSDKIEPHFSGERKSQSTYCTSNGVQINADLNASANIARKALPDIFSNESGHMPPDFENITIINDPFVDTL